MAGRSAFDCIDETMEEHSVKIGRWEDESSKLLKDPTFWKDVLSNNQARKPITHLELFLQKTAGNFDVVSDWRPQCIHHSSPVLKTSRLE